MKRRDSFRNRLLSPNRLEFHDDFGTDKGRGVTRPAPDPVLCPASFLASSKNWNAHEHKSDRLDSKDEHPYY
jgi:hypothetical protein